MDGFDFPVEVVRTERKRSATIHLDGLVIKVRVPQSLSENRIRELITKRKPWITSKLRESTKRPPLRSKEFVSGESFPYLGRNYRLKVVFGEEPSLKMKGGYLVSTVLKTDTTPQETTRSMLVSWYRKQAEKRLGEKTDRLAGIVGVSPKSVSVKSYKSRWGSCSVNGDISFNWRIVLAPHRIIDYVVVHELCHLREHNHSPHFWRQVEKHVPDWKECRDWLRHNHFNIL